MELDRAGLDAFDGVAIRLIGGRVLRVPCLTVAEAARYLRTLNELAEVDVDVDDAKPMQTIESFVAEFGERMRLGDVTLAEFGLYVEGVDGSTTFDRLRALLETLTVASWSENVGERSRAQIRWLDGSPEVLGVDLSPPDLFARGQELASAFYLHVYGLAQDFCSRLALGPPATTWAIADPRLVSTSAHGSRT